VDFVVHVTSHRSARHERAQFLAEDLLQVQELTGSLALKVEEAVIDGLELDAHGVFGFNGFSAAVAGHGAKHGVKIA
jgi:hypothetical protein